ncbi:MAG: chromosome segregation protein SMC, partial [Deltaproteobacteria bacterium]|nr:chromosome segregation protein SMC [Deltaproteobacteria bacterium]
MLLIELATQNVKGFSPTSRAALRPGYNVVAPPPGAQPGLLSIFAALFFNDGSGADAVLATGPQARAGLTAQGTDGRVYRLVRGLGGTGALHRLEPNNQWAVVAQENADIARHLRQGLGVPSRETFEKVFAFTPQSLPSRR